MHWGHWDLERESARRGTLMRMAKSSLSFTIAINQGGEIVTTSCKSGTNADYIRGLVHTRQSAAKLLSAQSGFQAQERFSRLLAHRQQRPSRQSEIRVICGLRTLPVNSGGVLAFGAAILSPASTVLPKGSAALLILVGYGLQEVNSWSSTCELPDEKSQLRRKTLERSEDSGLRLMYQA